MFAIARVLPCVRALMKYHTLSFFSGPPNDPLRSYTLVSGSGVVRPAAWSAGVKLLPCRFAPVPLAKIAPATELPPVFGTMFITSPAVSDSPRPPEVVNETSCALPTSAMYPGG